MGRMKSLLPENVLDDSSPSMGQDASERVAPITQLPLVRSLLVSQASDDEHPTVASDNSSSGPDPPIFCEETIHIVSDKLSENASERKEAALIPPLPQLYLTSQISQPCDNEHQTVVSDEGTIQMISTKIPEGANKQFDSVHQTSGEDGHQSDDFGGFSSDPLPRSFCKETIQKKSKPLSERQFPVHELKKRQCCLVSPGSWKVKFLCVVLLCVIIWSSSSRTGIRSSILNNTEAPVPPSDQPSSALLETASLAPSENAIGTTSAPSAQTESTRSPSDSPSLAPSLSLSSVPSDAPSSFPSLSPTIYEDETTTFYAVGDVPYKDVEKIQLRDRMMNLPDNGEFLIHVGDIRSGKNRKAPCRLEEYQEVRDILLQSQIPVFIVPGDNEWNDCPNFAEAQSIWRETFHEFDKNWNHTFQVIRNPSEPENFYFIHKRTLYFGLTLLGGRIRNSYSGQLRYAVEVVKSMIGTYVVTGNVVNVVIFGHAFPKEVHYRSFFDPLKEYIEANLNNTVPFMYLNGDKHYYESQENYMGLSNFHRLQVDSGAIKPPLKVAITASTSPGWNASEAFEHDRMLSLML